MPENIESQVRDLLLALGVSPEQDNAPGVTVSSPAEGTAASPKETALSAEPKFSELKPLVDAKKAASRDVPISTVVHLLGLPTAQQLSILEGKVDLLNTKLSSVLSKLEKMGTEISAIKADATVGRIDFQINEIKALLKRIVGGTTASVGGTEAKSSLSKARVIASETPESAPTKKPETKILEKDNLEEFEDEVLDDQSFQSQEAKRMRDAKSGA